MSNEKNLALLATAVAGVAAGAYFLSGKQGAKNRAAIKDFAEQTKDRVSEIDLEYLLDALEDALKKFRKLHHDLSTTP